MGQCMSTPGGNPYRKDWGVMEPKAKKGEPPGAYAQAKGYYDKEEEPDHGAGKDIIEGLRGAYKVLRLLGSGAEGNTYLVQDVSDQKQWAIKLIKLPLPTRYVQAISREIKLQSELGEGHSNIVTTEEVVLTSHYLGLVMEFAAGGALTSFLAKKFKENKSRQGLGLLMQEDEARYLFRQLANAVGFCHRHKVAHRDLKLDNTLITDDESPIIKLCDFGFARGWGESSHFTTVIGTPDYMSPQIIAREAGRKVPGGAQTQAYDGAKADVWAMGVLLCVMLMGKFPFDGDSVSEVEPNQFSNMSCEVLRQIWVQQNKRAWNSTPQVQEMLPLMSKEVQDLLDKIFELDEKKRPDVTSIKSHPWLQLPLRPQHQAAIDSLEKEQAVTEKRVKAGAYRSQRRDDAISDLIKLAASDEFKARASEPITAHTTFQIWSRIALKTQVDSYHVPNKKTLQQLIAESDKLSTRFAQSRSVMETQPMQAGNVSLHTEDKLQLGVHLEMDHESMPQPSNQPSKAIFRPRPDLGFRSMLHGSGGEKGPSVDKQRKSVDGKLAGDAERSSLNRSSRGSRKEEERSSKGSRKEEERSSKGSRKEEERAHSADAGTLP